MSQFVALFIGGEDKSGLKDAFRDENCPWLINCTTQ